MKTKKKILGTLASWVITLMFIASWAMLGIVLALQEASVNLGGSIEFIAKDIYADITGRVTGTKEPVTLDDIHFSAENLEFETPTSWSNMDLTFDEDATPIEIQVTINNKSTHPLYVDFTEGIDYQNVTVTRKKGGEDITQFGEFEIAGGTAETPTSQTLDITLKVTDMNNDSKGKLSLVIKLSSIDPNAPQDESVYDTLTFTCYEGNKTAEVKANSDNTPIGDLVIPAKVMHNGEVYNVTHVGNFEKCTSLKSVAIPAGVIRIGLFRGCTNLTSVTFAEGSQFDSIGWDAFRKCESLQFIIIPASVTSIEEGAFTECVNLNTVTFEEGSQCKNIGRDAFSWCSSLQSIKIPLGVTSIGFRAFNQCHSLQSISIPAGVTSIGDYAFSCSSLTSITVDKNNSVYTSYENGLYKGTTLIQGCQTTIIKEGTTDIAQSAFSESTGLRLINIPASVVNIGESAFRECVSLELIVIPASVTNIGSYAFYGCVNLATATFDNPIGWKENAKAISSTDLANSAMAALYLRNSWYEWTRA